MRQPTVLLVEDEPLIALDLQQELEAGGYKVLAAADGEEAQQLCGEFAFDLVILNYFYKNSSDGLALSRKLGLDTDTKLLFVTGADIMELPPQPSVQAPYRVLHKPYTRRQLRSVLLP